jgi:hypothetical protein
MRRDPWRLASLTILPNDTKQLESRYEPCPFAQEVAYEHRSPDIAYKTPYAGAGKTIILSQPPFRLDW